MRQTVWRDQRSINMGASNALVMMTRTEFQFHQNLFILLLLEVGGRQQFPIIGAVSLI